MKNIRLLIFLITIFIPTLIFSQVSLRFSVGQAQNSMSDLKKIQKEVTSLVQSELNLPIKDVENFPAHYDMELQLGILSSNNIQYGFIYRYSSTGARSSYVDYSGKYQVDYLLDVSGLGLFAEKIIPIKDVHNVIFGGKVFSFTSSLELKNTLVLWGNTNEESNEFESSSFGFSPYIGYQAVFGVFLTRIEIAYLKDFSDELHLPDNEKSFLIDNSGNKVQTNWSGFRFGVSIGINIK